jgi:broad specificity phosphatase PhoE
MHLLDVEDLVISSGDVRLVNGIDLTIAGGERVGLIGESGSGKSLTALGVMQLLPRGLSSAGDVRFEDCDLARVSERVRSSPLLRCVQTVQPLAANLGLPVETSEALGPRADRDAACLVRSLGSRTSAVVVCTHGETIEALQERLVRPGQLAFGPGSEHEKGSVWVLRGGGGWFTEAVYLRPGHACSGATARRGGWRHEQGGARGLSSERGR